MSQRGVFVVIEGIDGAGTTTQCARYAAHLASIGRTAHVTREPSDGPVGVLIRRMLKKEIAERSRESAEMMALLFAADRIDHNLSEIDLALTKGTIVISDRYDLSSLAYQSAAARSRGVSPSSGPMLGWIWSLNRFARRPDLTVVVDVPAEVARTRRIQRGGGEELYEAAALQALLAEIYAEAETLVPSDKLIHVDGTGKPEEVEVRIRSALGAVIEGPAREDAR